MSELSPRMEWTFPSEEEDPWYDRFVDFIRSLDASGFAAREDRNIILSGGGTISWSTGAGLTWTSPFQIFSPSTGFFTQLQPTTVVLADGEVIRFNIVRHPGQNNNVAPVAAPYAENTDNSMLLGMRVGDNFYFRSGQAMGDGDSLSELELFGGGANNFSWKTIPEGVSVTIPENQQMVLVGGITINGELNIEGELAFVAE